MAPKHRETWRFAFAAFALSWTVQLVSATAFSCTGGVVYAVAHADDDLLFQSPDLQTDMAKQKCVTTIFFTAGDSGQTGNTYMLAREAGNEAATALMAGVADQYTEFNATFGGQPVLIRTLVGAPQVQKVWFRIPDGNMDGTGFSNTGYQSLRALYFGSISQVTNKPGTASYTLSTLKQAVGEILAARKPDYVRTLDYMSDYDAGDHADHLTTARIIRDLVGKYAPNAGLSGYMGYPVQNFAPTISPSSAAFKAKAAAFFAYTPYDTAECQAYSDCVSANRGEASWLVRQYVVTPELAQHGVYGTALNPVALPNSTNVAPLAEATCSSETVWQPCSAAIDCVVSGYPANYSAEWATNQETTSATLKLQWSDPYNLTALALHDRVNLYDWITGGTLTFADGSSTSFGALANEGSATLVQLDQAVVTDSITLSVTSVGPSSSSVGLAEIRAYGDLCKGCAFTSASTATTVSPAGIVSGNGAYADLALQATATASSWSAVQPPDRAIDGVINGYTSNGKGNYSAEWASNGETIGAWLNLTWPAYYMIDSLVLYDRPNDNDWITGAHIDFDDGSSLDVPALKNVQGGTVLNFTAVNASSLQMTVTSAGPNSQSVGLAEIIAAYSQPQTPVNITLPDPLYVEQNQTVTSNSTSAIPIIDTSADIARNATATASSFSDNQLPESAIDGIVNGYKEDGTGSWMDEWASDHEGAGAWLLLTWPQPVTITQVVLYDRPNLSDRILKGNFTYSDGTGRTFGALNADGSATKITLAQAVTTTTLKITVLAVSSTTTSVGLAEVVVYGGQAANISNLSPIIANVTNNGTYLNYTTNITASGYSGSFAVPIPTASFSGMLNISASSPFPTAYSSGKSAVPTGYSSGFMASGSANASSLASAFSRSSLPVVTAAPSGYSSFASGSASGVSSFGSQAAGGLSSHGSLAASGASSLLSAGASAGNSVLSRASSFISSAVPVATGGFSGILANATAIAGSLVSSVASPVPTGGSSSVSALLSAQSAAAQASASFASQASASLFAASLASQASASQISASLASASQAAASQASVSYASQAAASAASMASASLASLASASGASVASAASASAASVASLSSVSQASVASASAYAASVASVSMASVSAASVSQASASSVYAASAAAASSMAAASIASVASASAFSASKASVASASSAYAASLAYGASVASASAYAASVASASAYAASVASVSAASLSAYGASVASASMASASRASASFASASLASASLASASLALVASASQAAASAASASQALASAASVSSASVYSASLASVSSASAYSASVAAASRASVSSALAASSTMVKTTSVIGPAPLPGPSAPAPPPPPGATTTSASATPTITAGANVNIAPSAVATASSWRSSSPPDGVNDKVIGGLSLLGFGNAGDEWATSSRVVPAWVELTFPQPYMMRSMRLYGPANINNNILSGYISFADNTKINFNSISSGGTWIDLGPAGKASTKVRITITSVGILASSVGLAEVQIYSSPHACGILDLSCIVAQILPL
ncbi:hypothetical protein OIV83_002386 [Microbotryomycetes sp. JL201]|nr:hypothetical protein OIV83_002386 [Microbotryomycetes sp. JL201]